MTKEETLAIEFVVDFKDDDGYSCMPSPEQAFVEGYRTAEKISEERIKELEEKLKIAEEALEKIVGKYELPMPFFERPTKLWCAEQRRNYDNKVSREALTKIRGEK